MRKSSWFCRLFLMSHVMGMTIVTIGFLWSNEATILFQNRDTFLASPILQQRWQEIWSESIWMILLGGFGFILLSIPIGSWLYKKLMHPFLPLRHLLYKQPGYESINYLSSSSDINQLMTQINLFRQRQAMEKDDILYTLQGFYNQQRDPKLKELMELIERAY